MNRTWGCGFSHGIQTQCYNLSDISPLDDDNLIGEYSEDAESTDEDEDEFEYEYKNVEVGKCSQITPLAEGGRENYQLGNDYMSLQADEGDMSLDQKVKEENVNHFFHYYESSETDDSGDDGNSFVCEFERESVLVNREKEDEEGLDQLTDDETYIDGFCVGLEE